MSRHLRRILVVVVLAVGAVVATQAAALAAPPPTGEGDNGEFLCPIVGDGVTNADSVNNDNGVSTIGPAAGVSLLPGGNQAGNNADSSALNDRFADDALSGPGGGNSGFSAIWPGGVTP